MHVAARFRAPVAVVQELLLAYSEAVMEKNWDGELPLHVALYSKASLEVIRELLKAGTDAVVIPGDADSSGTSEIISQVQCGVRQ